MLTITAIASVLADRRRTVSSGIDTDEVEPVVELYKEPEADEPISEGDARDEAAAEERIFEPTQR